MSHLQLTKRKISNETSCGTHKHKRSGGLPQIYCDMDMVICDFIGGYEQLTGKDFAKTDKDERWEEIKAKKDFWATLEWMPGLLRECGS